MARGAGGTAASCRDTLDHVANALCGYASSLANGLTSRTSRHPRNGDPFASPADLVRIAAALAGVLAAVAEGAPADRRAFHPAGMANRDGFVAMGCDEILVHGNDIAGPLGVTYDPPKDLAARTVVRLFPWAPTGLDPWSALLWVNGRVAVDGYDRLGSDWWWHCAPLSEWSGEPHRRSDLDPPGWR